MIWVYSFFVFVCIGVFLAKIHWALAVAAGMALTVFPFVYNTKVTQGESLLGAVVCSGVGGLWWLVGKYNRHD